MAVIFPFEPAVYAGTGLPVEFVGHPLVDRLPEPAAGPAERAAARRRARPRRRGARGGAPPGQPTERAARLAAAPARDRARARTRATRRCASLLALAPSLARESLDALLAREPAVAGLPLAVVERATYDAVRAADVVLVKPGTATVEIALLGTPMVVAARAHPLTAAIARRVLHVPSLTMVNLIAGRAGRARVPAGGGAARSASPPAVRELLDGPAARRRSGGASRSCAAASAAGGAARRAAEIAEEMLRGAARA